MAHSAMSQDIGNTLNLQQRVARGSGPRGAPVGGGPRSDRPPDLRPLAGALRRSSNTDARPRVTGHAGARCRDRLPVEVLGIQDRREDARRPRWRQPDRCLQELRGSDGFQVAQVQPRMAARDAHHERNDVSGRREADLVGKPEHRGDRPLLIVDREAPERPDRYPPAPATAARHPVLPDPSRRGPSGGSAPDSGAGQPLPGTPAGHPCNGRRGGYNDVTDRLHRPRPSGPVGAPDGPEPPRSGTVRSSPPPRIRTTA